jgi:hypothetical protein
MEFVQDLVKELDGGVPVALAGNVNGVAEADIRCDAHLHCHGRRRLGLSSNSGGDRRRPARGDDHDVDDFEWRALRE